MSGEKKRRPSRAPFLCVSSCLGGFFEIGKVWGGAPGTPSLPFDVAGAAVVKTLIGPIFGGVSGGDSGHYAWFFGLGRIF
jgi:NTE family protein